MMLPTDVILFDWTTFDSLPADPYLLASSSPCALNQVTQLHNSLFLIEQPSEQSSTFLELHPSPAMSISKLVGVSFSASRLSRLEADHSTSDPQVHPDRRPALLRSVLDVHLVHKGESTLESIIEPPLTNLDDQLRRGTRRPWLRRKTNQPWNWRPRPNPMTSS